MPAPSSELTAPIELTILMPCLNEAETIAVCVRKACAFIERAGIQGEVLIADNGSSDGSQEIARRSGARVVDISSRGYGAALHGGIQQARGRYIIMGDADDSYDFEHLDGFVEHLRAGADLVMGNRFQGGIRPGAMPWKNRYIGNPALSGLGRLFFNCPVKDFHCGLRGFSRNAYERLDIHTTGMEFASEMVVKATLLDMRIVEVATTLSKDGRSRAPHLRPWRDGWRHLRFMLLYSPKWLFLYPGLALMIVGSVLAAILIPAPLFLGAGVGLDVHTLLFAFAAVLIGFQSVSFAFFTRIYAYTEGLLPQDPFLEKLFRRFTLESGLVAGGILLLIGLATGVSAVVLWSRAGFGELDARQTLRTAIPAASLLCLGAQVILTSFLLSFLGLRRR
jgi:glycosyltransferase involved in cell wall biosynthesis